MSPVLAPTYSSSAIDKSKPRSSCRKKKENVILTGTFFVEASKAD